MSRISPLGHIRHAVAFGAHPDDLEVGAGGLIARLAAQGAEVAMVVASVPGAAPERRAEAAAGAARLGARLVLPADDARLEDAAMHALVARFDRVLAETMPELVIVHGAHDAHWDHALVHRAVLGALRRTRCDVLAFATRLSVGAAGPPPTCIVDITEVIEQKLAAIAEHRSQLSAAFVDGRRAHHAAIGAPHGLAFAEAYEVLRILM